MNVGDIVKLKSGSPEMTIDGFTLRKAECIQYISTKGEKDSDGYFVKEEIDQRALDLVKANNDQAD